MHSLSKCLVQRRFQFIAPISSSYYLSKTPKEITVRYEVEFLGKLDDISALWEALFTTEGELLSYRKIIIANTDNLDF